MASASTKEEKKISAKDPTGRIAWGRYLTIFLISAWMFVLGVLVGRGTAPVRFDIQKISKQLEELKAADVKEMTAPVEMEADEEKTKTTLGFYEELKKNTPAASPTVEPRSEPAKTRPESQPANKSAAAPETAKVDKQQPAAKPPPNAQKKPEVKSSAPNAAAVPPDDHTAGRSKGMTVQVASLKDLKDADALVKKLTDRGYPAYKTIAVLPDKGIWFRIRVGRFADAQAAGGVLARLKKDGYRPMVVEEK